MMTLKRNLFPMILLRKFYRYAMSRLRKEIGSDTLKRSAIVFAPHPDDEKSSDAVGQSLKRSRQKPI
jgi:hypothetical protein